MDNSSDLITAGIIFIFADMSETSSALVENAWHHCMHTLGHMAKVHPSARDYAIALNGFKQRHSPSVSQGTFFFFFLSPSLSLMLY